MKDVIVVGGGVIGLSIAWELAGQGMSVAVLEQGEFGREASWAGAGILPPGNPAGAMTAEARLRAASCILWNRLSEELLTETGIDNGYRNCGGIHITCNEEPLQDEIDAWRAEGVPVQELNASEVKEHEPKITRNVRAAYRLPNLSQVRNPWHVRALFTACAERGVELRAGQPVVGFDRKHEKINAVRTPNGIEQAGQFCVAGGAWSKQILAAAGCTIEVVPVRGQMLLLEQCPSPIRHVIEIGPRYLVPRGDGRILVGSTEENAGFEKRNTAEGIAELLELAKSLVPELANARFDRAWSGLRPGSGDGLPYIGRVPTAENLFVAAGHFRSGLQMSPATALLIRQFMLGEETDIPIDAYACDRHATKATN